MGLTRGATAAHVARATLEAIAYQVADVLEAMVADTGTPVAELRVDGGAAASDLLMQFQADILGVLSQRPAITETTALGAAYLAGLGVGLWKSPGDLAGHRAIERTFEPTMAAAEREARLAAVAPGRRARQGLGGLDGASNAPFPRRGKRLSSYWTSRAYLGRDQRYLILRPGARITSLSRDGG